MSNAGSDADAGWAASQSTVKDEHHGDAIGPLDGLKVIDLTTSYAGPTASMYLADLGAQVVKVERPGAGDDTRSWGPPFVDGASAWFASANRNKRSVVIDVRSAEGRNRGRRAAVMRFRRA